MTTLAFTIQGSRRRGLALGLLLAGALLLALVVVIPLWMAHRHYDSVLDDMGQRLERYERLAEARPARQPKVLPQGQRCIARSR